MLNFQYVLPFPTRSKASGTKTLAATSADSYAGTNARQKRLVFLISNLDTSNPLKIRNALGVIKTTVWPSVTLSFPYSEDIEVYNPHASASVQYEVDELFLDEGTSYGNRAGTNEPTGGAPATNGGSGGTSGSGGTTYGGSGGSPYSGGHGYVGTQIQ